MNIDDYIQDAISCPNKWYYNDDECAEYILSITNTNTWVEYKSAIFQNPEYTIIYSGRYSDFNCGTFRLITPEYEISFSCDNAFIFFSYELIVIEDINE